MIFLVGPHAAGKTHCAEIICQNNFVEIDLGPMLRNMHKESGAGGTFSEWMQKGEAEYGKQFSDDLVVKGIESIYETVLTKEHYPSDVVIVGSRSLQGIEYILKEVPNYRDTKNTIIFMDAPFDTLFERYKQREKMDISKEEFYALLERDDELGLNSLKPVADYTITNDGDENVLDREIKELVLYKLHYPELREIWEGKVKMR